MIYFILGSLGVMMFIWLWLFRRDDLRAVAHEKITDEMIHLALKEGHKITAIRYYRMRYGVGLKEAKEAVEALQATRV